MPYYRVAGEIPPKRHTQFRRPGGELYSEELMGAEGFSSDSALLYHAGVPSAIVDSRAWDLPDLSTTPNHPLRPRHLRLHALDGGWSTADAVTGRRLVLGNGDVRISYAVAGTASPLYRTAIGDECVYVEAGGAVAPKPAPLPIACPTPTPPPTCPPRPPHPAPRSPRPATPPAAVA
jgi:homogentisate 1,2-dioxygenase